MHVLTQVLMQVLKVFKVLKIFKVIKVLNMVMVFKVLKMKSFQVLKMHKVLKNRDGQDQFLNKGCLWLPRLSRCSSARCSRCQ